jgi:mono/diheme cytochrome c family protein
MSGTSVNHPVWVGLAATAVAAAMLGTLRGEVTLEQTPTFAKDVAPILQANCQVCHQPNSIAPMSLLTYEDAKTFGPLIKLRVQARTMPPWHIDRTVGIQEFKNDRSLSDEEIRTLAAWVDGGMQRGNPANEPPPVEWPDPNEWQLAGQFGAPDLVIPSEPYDVAAQAQDKWWRPTVETGVTEPRWVRAIEIKPSFPLGRKVVHHSLTTLLQEENGITGLASTAEGQRTAGLFMEWAVGKQGEIFNEDAGKLMLPGSRIRWEVHYHSVGIEAPANVVELGIWFYPKDYTPKNRTILNFYNAAPGSELDIPPGEMAKTEATVTLRGPARIENFQPHMHMRGKSMQMEAIYPDGRREILSRVSDFQWRWHVNYIYADDAAPLVPAGTRLVFTAWHDNTASNPNNPDPAQWVGWGDRTVDEMAHTWVDVTYLEQEDYERLLAERQARRKAR